MKEQHGLRYTPLYEIWKAMKQRCHNPRNKDFKHYGGRGITVCDRWRNSFIAFREDVGDRPRGMTLDRKDNSLGYEPTNFRWATWKEQRANTREREYSHPHVSVETVARIVELRGCGLSFVAIAKAINQEVRRSQVRNICNRELKCA